MNQFLQELQAKPTAQQCLVKYLEHLLDYFEKTSHLTEDKTYARLRKISSKIQAQIPYFHPITNVTHKLIANVRLKVDDKFEETSVQQILNHSKSDDGALENSILKEVMKLISVPAGLEDSKSRWEKSLNRNVDEKWMRGLLIEEIKSLKEDLHSDENVVLDEIKRIFTNGSKILFFDSYLSNSKVMQQLMESGIEVILVTVGSEKVTEATKHKGLKKLEQIDLTQVSSVIGKCKGVVLSADAILLNGGILSGSGSLMVAAAARKYNVPIMALGRGFSLTEKIVIKQRVLLEQENPLDYFSYNEGVCQKVLIGKRLDYIQGSLLTRVVCELGEGVPSGVYSHYKQYYYY